MCFLRALACLLHDALLLGNVPAAHCMLHHLMQCHAMHCVQVNYKNVMKQYGLGPNGGILTACNLFATRFDQASAHNAELCQTG